MADSTAALLLNALHETFGVERALQFETCCSDSSSALLLRVFFTETFFLQEDIPYLGDLVLRIRHRGGEETEGIEEIEYLESCTESAPLSKCLWRA